MKRQICDCPAAKKILAADRPLEKQIEKNTAQLRRVHRSLQSIGASNRKLLRATKHLLKSIAHDADPVGGTRARKQLAKLYSRHDSLTPRERQVMALVVSGFPNKQIAAQLGTAEITVKVQRANVMKKMKADSLADLARMAERMRAGLWLAGASRFNFNNYRLNLKRILSHLEMPESEEGD